MSVAFLSVSLPVVSLFIPIIYLLLITFSLEDGSCEINVGPVGCYKENGTDLAMQEVFHNEVSPGLPNFDGNLLPDSSDDYIAAFPDFLCKCARKAAENKWEYFGVRELGELLTNQ